MEKDIAQLQQQIKGKILQPGSAAYQTKQHTFNAVGQPAIIVQCTSPQDVVETLQFAKKHKLELSVRSGGHGASGAATNKGGLVLDVSPMNTVEIVDIERRIVRVGAGATWGEVAGALEPHGLVISAGDTNQVGVGGLTLGGGFGWLVRTYGLAIDALRSVELVTADGRLLVASATENPDLFWAVRGGGGNFGVATAFEVEAQPLTTIRGGSMTFDVSETAQVLAGLSSYMRAAPDELNVTVEILPGSLRLIVCYAGDDKGKADQAIAPLVKLGKVTTFDIGKKPYADMLGNTGNKPPDFRLLQTSGFIKQFDAQSVQTVDKHFGQGDQPRIEIRFLGGAYRRVGKYDTALAYREYEALVIVTDFGPPGTPETEARQKAAAAWMPFEQLAEGRYTNFVAFTDDQTAVHAYPERTLTKLCDVKLQFDPDNVFQGNVNILPKKAERKYE